MESGLNKARRGARIFLSVVWVALFLAVSWMWVRSYWVGAWGYIARATTTQTVGPPGQVGTSGYSMGVSSGMGRVVLGYGENGNQSFGQVGANITHSYWLKGASKQYPQYSYELPRNTFLQRVGFGHRTQGHTMRPRGPRATMTWEYSRKISFPYWLPVLVLALGAWQSVKRSIRQTREAKAASEGRCIQCGYDLRGSAGACPECGVKIGAG